MTLGSRRERLLFSLELGIAFYVVLLISAWDVVAHQSGGSYFAPVEITLESLGVILFITGLTIRVQGKRTLGKYFSGDLRVLEDHEIVKDGMYRYVRHPLYLGFICLLLAVPLIFFHSLFGFVVMLVLVVPIFLNRIRNEETMLIKQFGDAYTEYMRTTKRLFPFIY
jgi:protein-S-isoprenylcysteine O-methyltransferase Ste14